MMQQPEIESFDNATGRQQPKPVFGRLRGKPIERLQKAKHALGDQYWLYLGMCFVGMFIGSLLPFGILMGPVVCGLYYAYRERVLGRQMTFDHLMKGADYFGDALIAGLVQMLVVGLVLFPVYLVAMGLFLFSMTQIDQNAGNAFPVVLFAGVMFFNLLLMFLMSLLAVPFVYVYPLIVDRKLNGMDAVKTSWAAARGNFFAIWWFMVGNMFSNMLAALACWFPALFLMPLNFGAFFELYHDTFGIADDPQQAEKYAPLPESPQAAVPTI